MKVYKPEIDDGLAVAVQESCRFTAACQIQKILEPQSFIDANQEELRKKLGETLGSDDQDIFDLYPVRTIMVTTGWNGNTDIFDRFDTWAARLSPINKPFNVGHIPRQIIGHIVYSYGMTEEFEVIASDVKNENLPDKFHLVTDAVIYRHLGRRDPQLTQEITDIIAGIENGDWYVSMECLFDGFDYGLRDLSTGEEKIIRRQESTAFLTKHLRQYKGSGVYANNEIGRVLRGITFSGKGLVENPANPESIFIFNDVKAFAGCETEDIEFLVNVAAKEVSTNNGGDNFMSEELKVQVADLQRQLAEANTKLRELDQEAIKAERDARVAQIAKLDETIATLNDKITELQKSYNEAEQQVIDTNEAKAEVEKKLAEATVKLTEIETEAKQTGRVSTLVDKGVDKAKAEEVVAEFADLDDTKFETVVKMQTEIVAATTTQEEQDETVAGEETDEEDGETEGESTAEETALEDAEEDGDDADLASAGTSASDEKEQAQADLSEYLGSILGN